MKQLKKWIGRLSSILIYGLLICMIFTVVSAKIAGGTPKVSGYEIMTVLSGSMEPGIKTGSIIAVKPVTDTSNFKKGDVITFKEPTDPKTVITHRIIDVQKAGTTVQYVTKGDNNKTKDPSPVPAINVIAKYSGFTIPYVGRIMAFIQSKTGAIYLLIVPGALMILASILSIWRTISQIDTKKQKQAS